MILLASILLLMLHSLQCTDSDAYYYYSEEAEEATSTVASNAAAPAPDTNDVYYYESTEEEQVTVPEVAIINQVQNPIIYNEPPPPPAKYGFYENYRGKILLTSGPLVTRQFMNHTADEYDCVVRKDHFNKKEGISVAEKLKIESKQNNEESIIKKIVDGNEKNLNKEGSPAVGVDEGDKKENAAIKRLSFRERELLKMEQKKLDYQKGQKGISLYRLGPNCEDRICTSCKIIVEEFGSAVLKAITNPKYKYVMDILEDNFCNQRDIQMKYKAQVHDLCKLIVKTKDYKDTFINAFEEEDLDIVQLINKISSSKPNQIAPRYWDVVMQYSEDYIQKKKVHICNTISACTPSDFEIPLTSNIRVQEFWNESCFVCNYVMQQAEVRGTLENGMSESKATSIINNICNKSNLVPFHQRIPTNTPITENPILTTTCESMRNSTLVDDLGWMLKVHVENIEKRQKGEFKFQDKTCREIKYCEKWVDPEEKKKKELEQTIEAVFS